MTNLLVLYWCEVHLRMDIVWRRNSWKCTDTTLKLVQHVYIHGRNSSRHHRWRHVNVKTYIKFISYQTSSLKSNRYIRTVLIRCQAVMRTKKWYPSFSSAATYPFHCPRMTNSIKLQSLRSYPGDSVSIRSINGEAVWYAHHVSQYSLPLCGHAPKVYYHGVTWWFPPTVLKLSFHFL